MKRAVNASRKLRPENTLVEKSNGGAGREAARAGRIPRKHEITPLMYLYNGGESSFIMTPDSLEYLPLFPSDPGLLLRNSCATKSQTSTPGAGIRGWVGCFRARLTSSSPISFRLHLTEPSNRRDRENTWYLRDRSFVGPFEIR